MVNDPSRPVIFIATKIGFSKIMRECGDRLSLSA